MVNFQVEGESFNKEFLRYTLNNKADQWVGFVVVPRKRKYGYGIRLPM
jgi:hypothetical protein